MEEELYISYDENGEVLGSFGFEPENPFITVPSSVWQQFSIYEKDDLSVVKGAIIVSNDAVLSREIELKKRDFNTYLASTDWVEPYLIRHELGIDILPPDSNKWEIKVKRDEAHAFLQVNP